MSEYKGIGAFYLPCFIPVNEWPAVNIGHEGACGWTRYVPERMCHVIDRGTVGACSACGDECFGSPKGNEGTYCPCCGAKVVDE